VPLRALENFQESQGINTCTPLYKASTEPEVDENNNTSSGKEAVLRDFNIICEGARSKGACNETSAKLQNTTKVGNVKL
jgi:hypothetical protein